MDDPQKESMGPAVPRPLREGGLDPYPWYESMRTSHPVRYDEGHEIWDVFRFDDVKRVLSDQESFSAAEVSHFDPNEKLPGKTMMDADPPDHGRLRSVVDDYFTPGNLNQFEPAIETIVEEQLERVTDKDEFDFAEDFARAVTLSTILTILGVPSEEWETFKEWQEEMHFDPEEIADSQETQARRARAATQNMIEYFEELLDQRTGDPRDDVLSVIANTDQEEKLTHGEKLAFCVLLLRGGNNTTTAGLTNTLWTLKVEDLLEDFVSGDLDSESTFDEVLRYRSPVQMIPARATTTSVEIAGVEIPAGERLRPWIGSANRDPRQFDDPEQFDPDRTPNAHIAFGTGIHYCLGAPLAKLEGRIALNVLQQQAAEIDVRISDLERNASPLLRPKRLPIRIKM